MLCKLSNHSLGRFILILQFKNKELVLTLINILPIIKQKINSNDIKYIKV